MVSSLYLKVATTYYNAHFGESSGPYHLDYVYCNGYETNLLVCSHHYTIGGVYNNGIGVHNCAPGNEAGVKCDGMILLTMLKLQMKCEARTQLPSESICNLVATAKAQVHASLSLDCNFSESVVFW